MDIQWYPGHMTKARRAMEQDLKLVDAIVEVLDARVPVSSRNPDIIRLGAGKKRILVLNKADLADPSGAEAWKTAYEAEGYLVSALDARSTGGIKAVKSLLNEMAREKQRKDRARGILNRPVRIMVAGIPNVGKSTLINSLAGRASAKTGDKPGVTRGNQWIRLGGSVEMLDTPGILWPKFDDPEVGLKLALLGTVNDDILTKTELAASAVRLLRERFPGRLEEVFGELPEDPYALIEALAGHWHMIKKGGVPDEDRAAAQLLDWLRAGKLGKLCLELPSAEIKEKVNEKE